MRVDSSRRCGDLQLQYLECVRCAARRSRVVDRAEVWPRKGKA